MILTRIGKSVCLVSFALAPVLLSGCVDSKSIAVHRERMFAQKHVLNSGEKLAAQGTTCSSKASTKWDFVVKPTIAVAKERMERTADGCTITVKVKRLDVEVALPIDMWVADGADAAVVAHEDGHIKICKNYYRDAAKQARKCATHVLNRDFSGQGVDEETAEKQAIDKVSAEIVNCYREKISMPAERANAQYDKLTSHGEKQNAVRDPVAKAIAETN